MKKQIYVVLDIENKIQKKENNKIKYRTNGLKILMLYLKANKTNKNT